MYGLQGRKAIVTGAAHGIGRAIAARLLAEGCDVGIFDLDLAAANAAAEALGKDGGKVVVASGDVSSRADVEAGIGALKDALGPIDILVNNAGICKVGKLLETSEAEWKATFGINVDGLFHVTRQIAPGMVERRSGTIVNIASWMGKSGVAAYGAYCASKFAVVSLTQSLALEIGEYGIRVNAVAPGLIVETKMRDESEIQRAAEGLPTAKDRAKQIPLRRAGLPSDIAKTVAFLASDEADYITGETISVTGGIWND
ncbi:MAG TPA: SDR family NAD(P)-dependent oxidoreductase [Bosea sp. (in: a-proteobacteria)]|jgi:NAD(P)-dependent dehydrogenase (short-subunit alcohol dehydrogenase family)|uniref:SDR family NAD(P)-dependent oxidoreductase n=1 Tax=Bosea sp. (in: a-proteobacteria) TaxID=1871050 RepID=UPI002E158E47|nr:SDR family NAD(P)-dependent oxidoreductase [Bosea sp. (in: a-proteobacteria)]